MRPKRSTIVTLATSVAAACSVLLAPAGPANAEGNAQATIDGLEFAGYTVNFDRVGSLPIAACDVLNVRNPHTVTRLIKVYNGHKDKSGHRDYDLVEVVVSKTIQVSLDCTNSPT